MAWTKTTNKCAKPFKWWMHKVFCEWGWLVRNKDCSATYNHHLDMLCKQGFNLYGEPIK